MAAHALELRESDDSSRRIVGKRSRSEGRRARHHSRSRCRSHIQSFRRCSLARPDQTCLPQRRSPRTQRSVPPRRHRTSASSSSSSSSSSSARETRTHASGADCLTAAALAYSHAAQAERDALSPAAQVRATLHGRPSSSAAAGQPLSLLAQVSRNVARPSLLRRRRLAERR